MTNTPDLAVAFRVAYLRELWRRLAVLYPAPQAIAIYGAGRHTRFLLNAVHDIAPAPSVRFILDDSAGQSGSPLTPPPEIQGVPVRSPSSSDPASVTAVVVSSDSVEPLLAARARAWMTPGAALFTPYSELPPGPYPPFPNKPEVRFGSAWGNSDHNPISNHLPVRPDDPVLVLASKPDPSIRTGPDNLPYPPPDLRAGYNRNDDAAYFERGRNDATLFRSIVARHDDLANFTRILDWGCSTGRIIRHFADIARRPGAFVVGADACAQSIDWTQRHLSPPFAFTTSTFTPPLPFADTAFDLVYSCSVFTHIRDLWDTWLFELRRVIRPGGMMLTTILDEHAYERARNSPGFIKAAPSIDFTKPMPPDTDMLAGGSGANILTFWTRAGIQRRWSGAFEILGFYEGVFGQTTVALRRPR